MVAKPAKSSLASAGLTETDARPSRLDSLDAFRGAIILMMISSGLGFSELARSYPDCRLLAMLGHHSQHALWAGGTLWDLIQPAFMFMVGMALPWSIANRLAKGDSIHRMSLHALRRSMILILLAVFLSSAWSQQTDWSFTNVLAQIGLGYPFLFLLAFTGTRTRWLAAGGILAAYWLLFALHPLPAPDFDWQAIGVPPDWPRLTGFSGHWEKNANPAASFDQWFLNLFPREKDFIFNSGGYQTLNFVPSLATMIFGLIVGQRLRNDGPIHHRLVWLLAIGSAGVLLGWLLHTTGLCPMVKRIWTPSWALASTGWIVLMLALFVALIDGKGWRRPAFPLIVAGFNPITLYLLWQLSGPFIKKQVRTHFGQDIFLTWGEPWQPFWERLAVLLILWLVAWWMYRAKIFIRI
jgi:heparan-alpha-glucosaminide N-acetyltransferase